MRVYQSLSSLRTAIKASVGTCTVPRFRIFFLPAPHKSKLLWGPRIRSKWPEMNSAHFKVLPAAKRLDAAFAAGRQKESIAVQLEDGHEGLGGNLKIMGKANQGLSVRDNHVLLSQMDVPGALVVLAIAAVLVVAVLYLFFGTELGCGIRATGCNPVMSRAQGINTDLSKVIGLSLSNGLVALSGALLCQYQGYADINMGRGAVVIGLAAVVIGEAVVKHISPNFAVRLTGVLVGAVIYYLVYQVIIFVGFDTDLLKMFSALVVAAFLGVPYVKKQLARKHHVKGGIRHA